jgi:hypothetical protein
VPNRIYSLLASFIAHPLRIIFERSISLRRFPTEWKKAVVVPIPKTSPPILNKLRTISLLPSPAKILEKLVLKNIYHNLEPLFGVNQHAFRKRTSTTTALLAITDSLTKLYDDPTVSGFGIISLDFSKAFDLVDHSVLLKKMRNTPITEGLVLWLRSYLSERTFQVRIQGQLSTTRSTHSGVPQGSVLGPALFSILVADLTCNDSNMMVQYADDANVILPFQTKDPRIIEKLFLDQILAIRKWCSLNKQELNVEKSKIMIHMRSSSELVDLPIPCTESLKILGVHLSSDLTWDNHIESICKKACQRLHILRILKPHTSKGELHDIYIALLRSLFDYN